MTNPSPNNHIAVIGLAPMGKNLAKNLANHDYKVAVFNRTFAKTQELLAENNPNIVGFENLNQLVESLERPRKVIIMVKSGQPVDTFIEEVHQYLEDGDILIDCGNSNWKDTLRRQKQLADSTFYTLEKVLEGNLNLEHKKNVHFVGCGVSGGWLGALTGPSIMPGGSPEAVNAVLPILQKIAAKDFAGQPAVTNVGLEAAGHFVKMVHNGIEYAIMEGIAEIYDIVKQFEPNQNEQIKIFEKLNQGEINSYLLDVTIQALKLSDSEGFVLPRVEDKAGAKGTGKWTVEAAMDLGIATPNIAAAVFARIMSSRTGNLNIPVPPRIEGNNFKAQIPDLKYFSEALKAIYFTSYLQGMDLILEANKIFGWQIDIQEVIRIWQGGCIIRSLMLKDLGNLLKIDSSEQKVELTKQVQISRQSLVDFFNNVLQEFPGIITILAVYNSSFDYCNVILTESLPTNLIQLQRHIFGDHEIVIK